MNLEQFYIENPARRSSAEADYGVWWKDGPSGPYHRVSYVRATGEVYAMNLLYREVEVLGVVPVAKEEAEDGRPLRHWHRTLDSILEGWPDQMHEGLQWVRERLR